MTSSLWDYDDIEVETGPWVSNSSKQEASVVVEDEDGNGQLKKRGRGRPSRGNRPAQGSATPSASVPVVVLDGDSDEDVKITGAGTMCSPVAGAAASTVVSPLQPQLCDAARQALEQSRQLAAEQMKELDDDDDDDGLLEELQPPKKAASMGPGSRRLLSSLLAVPLARAASMEAAGAACMHAEPAGASGGAERADAAAEPDNDDKLRVMCQSRHGSFEIKIRRTDAFSKLLKAFHNVALDKGWISGGAEPPAFKLQFDGDAIEQDQTPDDLGLEDGDVVDVSWKK